MNVTIKAAAVTGQAPAGTIQGVFRFVVKRTADGWSETHDEGLLQSLFALMPGTYEVTITALDAGTPPKPLGAPATASFAVPDATAATAAPVTIVLPGAITIDMVP